MIYTIGYSGYPETSDFVAELVGTGVRVLIDVRSNPHSGYFEVYDRERLEPVLRQNGILYRNYSREFGARQEDRSFYLAGRLDFEAFRASGQFREGVEKVHRAMEAGYTPALMCAEKDPVGCHRAIMVAKAFHDEGLDVIHLMPEGRRKTQEELEEELLDMYFPDREQLSLFGGGGDGELIAQAYRLQNDKIGYKLEDLDR